MAVVTDAMRVEPRRDSPRRATAHCGMTGQTTVFGTGRVNSPQMLRMVELGRETTQTGKSFKRGFRRGEIFRLMTDDADRVYRSITRPRELNQMTAGTVAMDWKCRLQSLALPMTRIAVAALH